jgi:hypothetical protein
MSSIISILLTLSPIMIKKSYYYTHQMICKFQKFEQNFLSTRQTLNWLGGINFINFQFSDLSRIFETFFSRF